MSRYTDIQLDALRELANIGSGTASTALSSLLGRSVDISVPNAFVLPMAEAVGTIGDPESEATGVVLGIVGEMPGSVLLLFTPKASLSLAKVGSVGVTRKFSTFERMPLLTPEAAATSSRVSPFSRRV